MQCGCTLRKNAATNVFTKKYLCLSHHLMLGIQIKVVPTLPFTHTSHPSVCLLWRGRGMRNVRAGVGQGNLNWFQVFTEHHQIALVTSPHKLTYFSLWWVEWIWLVSTSASFRMPLPARRELWSDPLCPQGCRKVPCFPVLPTTG